MTKSKLRIAIRSKETLGKDALAKRTIKAYTREGIETEYTDLLVQEKALAEKKTYLQDIARREAGSTPDGSWGRFKIQNRKSLSWRMSDVKKILPLKWEAFIVANDKMLKLEMEETPELSDCAIIKETTALTFSSKV